MTRSVTLFAALLTLPLCAAPALAQTSRPASQPTTSASQPADTVAATVNGRPIMVSEVNQRLMAILQAQTRGAAVPEAMLAQARERLQPEILNAMVDDELFDQDVEQAHIELSDEVFVEELDRRLRGHLARSGMTREEIEAEVRQNVKMSLQEFIVERAGDEEFRRSVLHIRLLEKKYPDDFKITSEAIQARYNRDLERIYTRGATVKASHILFATEQAKTDEEKAELRKKAEGVLAEAKKPDADFGALAALHSSCPSKTRAGDLGFFPRDGAMVEPFAAAAFAMKLGEISNIVETRFGYHIIKVTDRKEASVTSLHEATEAITDELKVEKMAQIRKQHLDKLRASAKIELTEPKPTTTQQAPQGTP